MRMKNGRDDSHDDPKPDPKITRIEDARRERARGTARSANIKPTKPAFGASRDEVGRGDVKEWIIGGVIVAMAIGFVISIAMPIMNAVVK